MNGLKPEFEDHINFYRLDANLPENENLQNELALMGHPTIALIDASGAVVNRYFGAQTEADLRQGLSILASER